MSSHRTFQLEDADPATMTGWDVMGRLYDAASDVQADVLTDLQKQAGFTWACECGYINPTSEATCEECSKPRHHAESS